MEEGMRKEEEGMRGEEEKGPRVWKKRKRGRGRREGEREGEEEGIIREEEKVGVFPVQISKPSTRIHYY